jgi:hypothetical protein
MLRMLLAWHMADHRLHVARAARKLACFQLPFTLKPLPRCAYMLLRVTRQLSKLKYNSNSKAELESRTHTACMGIGIIKLLMDQERGVSKAELEVADTRSSFWLGCGETKQG